MTIDEVRNTSRFIRHLDPKPGSRYNRPDSHYVIPDVYVVKIEDQYVAVLNEEGLPQLRISPVYRRLLDKSADNTDRDAGIREGQVPVGPVADQVVEQRQKTIHKVATSIITSSGSFSTTGSSSCGRWCCATWPTTSACTSRR